MLTPDRRLLLAALSASLLPPAARAVAADAVNGAGAVRLGPSQDFSFDALTVLAKKNASQLYKAPPSHAAQIIKGIDFDAAQKIKFRADHALWPHGPGPDPVSFFHLNKYSADPVTLHVVEGGKARAILYGPDYFDYSVWVSPASG
jgi:periplasmic glucans biosynthesis protein